MLFPDWPTLSSEVNEEMNSGYKPTVFCAKKGESSLENKFGSYKPASDILSRSIEMAKVFARNEDGDVEKIVSNLNRAQAALSRAPTQENQQYYMSLIRDLVAHVTIPRSDTQLSSVGYENVPRFEGVEINAPIVLC
jgi:hypothetical protein